MEAKREPLTAKRGRIRAYLETLRAQDLVRNFDEALWYGTVEQVRIGEDGKMKFIFKDGLVIES